MSIDTDNQGWGLLGPGRFAREFAEELKMSSRARLVAVASRNLERATEFSEEFGFEKAFGSYDELFADPAVDIVYIVVPHVFHRELSKKAIDAGKGVLCEKPLTPSLSETEDLLQHAKEKKVFLMEAMKTGFLPAIQMTAKWINEGRIGEPRLMRADFCFRGPTDVNDRLMNPDLAGGAVLDVGIYPLYLAHHFFGRAEEIHAAGTLAETGVEDSASIVTQHANGVSAAMTCSFRTEESMGAVIQGTDGEIRIPKFHAAQRLEWWKNGKKQETYEDASGGMVGAEIEAVMDSLGKGEIECSGHSHDDTRELARMMEEVRTQIVQGGATLLSPAEPESAW